MSFLSVSRGNANNKQFSLLVCLFTLFVLFILSPAVSAMHINKIHCKNNPGHNRTHKAMTDSVEPQW